jgi:pimeloyl-ACP methyl ester carboxylesterase/DNA-binding CsgD family transcriptional regulator
MNPQTPSAEHTRCADPAQRNVKDVFQVRASGWTIPHATAPPWRPGEAGRLGGAVAHACADFRHVAEVGTKRQTAGYRAIRCTPVRCGPASVGLGPCGAIPTQRRLADGHRFVWYDRCGCGLSDCDQPTTTLDGDVDELVAVLDALDIERADFIGYSMGGPTALAFAARYPDRVRHLVLYATLARGADLANDEFRDALVALVRSGWPVASRLLASTLLPEATAADLRWFARFQQRAATAENAAKLLQFLYDMDVRDLLGEIRVPTTVIGASEGVVMRMSHASELAAGIPGARLMAVGGNTHDPFIRDVTDVVDAILAAVEGRPQNAAHAPRDPTGERAPLTRRESDVLSSLADGNSNKEIAARLGVSVATVERHLTNVYRKLNANGRADAAVRGVRLGLVQQGR